MRLHSRCMLLLGIFLFGLVLGIYWLYNTPLINQSGLLREYLAHKPPSQSPLSTRSILLWSSFFGDKRWGLPSGTLGPQEFRDELHCPIYQCELSNQHDFLPALELYDAIVFHVAEPFPFLKLLPQRRRSEQAYVFALMEPPGETKHQLNDEQLFYNLTMSYHLESDIVWPYAHILDVETGAVVAPSVQPYWRKPPAMGSWNDSTVWNLWPGKSKMAAWFVSHCKTLSRRGELAAALQQHIQVDIYGKCGTLSCARGDKRCDTMLDTDYKFYLAFENSLCVDYVTEKLYAALQRYIIPVVFGGANYTRFLPPHSYIDADSFDNVQQLAEYMEFVGNNRNEYLQYFWWRKYYKLGHKSPFCDLCAKLHSSRWSHRTQYYTDIQSWWFNSCHLHSHIQFGTV